MSLAQLACQELENERGRKTTVINGLSRREKLALISSILSGVGSKAHFDEETLRSRINQCLMLAENIL